ncbi:hypothetical protein [Vallitalea okinawensis]|uniref:hypothetical protein n=1 Tax=Vallitalea okinawensis TaxID=2078660 RepID=UPI000CFACF2A|nr:hypothetical protein [Vallitalea okinawensis]
MKDKYGIMEIDVNRFITKIINTKEKCDMKHWLYPANVKYYDVVEAFTTEDLIAWPMTSKVEVGDTVYMYLGQPFKQIMFKCQAEEINVPLERVMDQANKYIKTEGKSPKKNFMLLKRLEQYDKNQDGPLAFSMMKLNGLKGSIMGPQCLENNETLYNYIHKMD